MHAPQGAISNADWHTVAAGKVVRWPLRVRVLGDTSHDEFRDCVEQIVARTEASLLSALPGELEEESEPDLCIVLAGRPGEFTPEVIESLRQRAPLVRVVGLLGSWCEGETRTGRPWPAVPRIYFHRWQAWFERELAAWENGECGTLSLPVTATDEERLLDASVISSNRAGVTVAIYSPVREMASMLVEACASLGYNGRRCELVDSWSNAPPAIGIYDAATCDVEMLNDLHRLTAHWPATRWLAVANFPRPDDVRQLRDARAAAVLSKPLMIDELRVVLSQLACEPSLPDTPSKAR